MHKVRLMKTDFKEGKAEAKPTHRLVKVFENTFEVEATTYDVRTGEPLGFQPVKSFSPEQLAEELKDAQALVEEFTALQKAITDGDFIDNVPVKEEPEPAPEPDPIVKG